MRSKPFDIALLAAARPAPTGNAMKAQPVKVADTSRWDQEKPGVNRSTRAEAA